MTQLIGVILIDCLAQTNAEKHTSKTAYRKALVAKLEPRGVKLATDVIDYLLEGDK